MNKGVSGNKLEIMSTRSARIVAVSNTVMGYNRLMDLLQQTVYLVLLPYQEKSFLHSSKLLAEIRREEGVRKISNSPLLPGQDIEFVLTLSQGDFKSPHSQPRRERGARGRGKAGVGGTDNSAWLS